MAERTNQQGNCATCRYWSPGSSRAGLRSNLGECRRRSPVAHPEQYVQFWPLTKPLDWCGEYQSRAAGSS